MRLQGALERASSSSQFDPVVGPPDSSKSKLDSCLTTSKKRKFNQISQATSQMESLNLEQRLGSKVAPSKQLEDQGIASMKRRRLNEISNLSGADQVSQYVSLMKSESKPAPFSTLFNKNSANMSFLSRQNSVELLSIKAS
jgi:hypothetical protein